MSLTFHAPRALEFLTQKGITCSQQENQHRVWAMLRIWLNIQALKTKWMHLTGSHVLVDAIV